MVSLKFKYQPGFSLLELTLALLLGAILLAGLLQIYLSVKSLYQTQKAETTFQENMRFSSYILTQNISMAGYAGCAKLKSLQLTDAGHVGFGDATSIQGFDSNHLPRFLSKKDVVPNTDIIMIQKADADETRVIGAGVNIGATSIEVYQNPATKNNRILLISNCETADLFGAKNYDNGTKIETNTLITHQYAAGTSVVGRYTELAYFISNTGNQDQHAVPIYGLYVMTNKGDKEELLEGISSMKIKYGLDVKNQGTIDGYYNADYIIANKLWTKVVSVIITLTEQNAITKQKSWNIYIKLRNRG